MGEEHSDENEEQHNIRTKHDGRPFMDIVLFYMILKPLKCCLEPVWSSFCKIRWMLNRPLNGYVFPKTILSPSSSYSSSSSSSILKKVSYITIGEVLFFIPIVIILYLSYDTSFTTESANIVNSGTVASIALIVTFLTANKSNSIISFVLGVPFDRMVHWHFMYALLSLVTGVFHYYISYTYSKEKDAMLMMQDDDDTQGGTRWLHSGEVHTMSIYSQKGPQPNLFKYSFDGQKNTTGTISLLMILLLTIPNLSSLLRKWSFELFYYSHIVWTISLLVFSLLHKANLLIYPLIWYALDLLFRYAVCAACLYPHTASVKNLPSNIIEISFTKPPSFDYNPGQFIMLAIPQISISQFHPFSISSSPHQDTITIHIRALGDWTRKLKAIAEQKNQDNDTTIGILMEGPYGSLAIDLFNDEERYKMVVLISGGIGITPMQSICNALLHEREVHDRPLKKLHFVWSVKHFDMVKAMRTTDSTRTGSVDSNKEDSSTDGSVDGTVHKQVKDDNFHDNGVESSFQPNLIPRKTLSLLSYLPKSPKSVFQLNDEESSFNDDADSIDKNNSNATEKDTFNYQADFYLSGNDTLDNDDLPSHIRLGRPNIREILTNMKKNALEQKEGRVAVCVCGPKSLVDACREECRKLSDESCTTCSAGVQFDLHEEVFEL